MTLPPAGCLLGCGHATLRRGLCVTHYHLAWERVRRGEVTWQELEQAGQAGPGKPRRLPRPM